MSHRKEIFATINLAHYFQSAFTADQVYRYLRVKLDRADFEESLAGLLRENLVFEKSSALFTRDLESYYRRKKRWSRDLFTRHRRYLALLARVPWIQYLALTGANAFESCRSRDDIDLFLITRKDRLWLCYLLLVAFSKLFRKRQTLCINYLIDEAHLAITQRDYFTAVQIMQMVPLCESDLGEKLIKRNLWVFDFLPNADPVLERNRFYVLKNGRPKGEKRHGEFPLLDFLNRLIYQRYARRLHKKYPGNFGRGIVLGEGVAKLNRIDHHDIYDRIYREIDREIPSVLTS